MTIEMYKPGLPKKITNSSGRVDVITYDANDKPTIKYTNGNLIERKVTVSGKEYELHWADGELDPLKVDAVIDVATGRILDDDEAEKIISQVTP
jgi:hypothetical protein